MSLQSSTPHDSFGKRVFTDLILAREFLALNLPADLVQLIDLSTLFIISGNFVDEDHRSHQSDVLYQVDTVLEVPIILYVLLEHKSNPDKWTILQLLRYMLNKWEQDISNGADQLTPIVPILFYHGQREWPYAINLRDYFPQDDAWNLFIPGYEMILVDLSEKAGAEISGSRYLQSILHAFRTVQSQNFERAFLDLVRFLIESLSNSDPRGLQILKEIVYYYTEGAERLTLDQFEAAFEEYDLEGENVMQTVATILRNEGRVEGRAEGLAEAREALQHAILETLETRFGMTQPKIHGTVTVIQDLEQLRKLMPIAAITESLAAFEAELE